MPHYDDLTLMMFEDRELTDAEAKQVAEHLEHCFHCRCRWQALKGETCFLASLFQRTAHSLPEPHLDSFTYAQIKGITSLHKSFRRRAQWRCAALTAGLLIAAAIYLIFWQSIRFDWMAAAWKSWNLWASVLWLRESAHDLLDLNAVFVIVLALPFLLLIGVLLILNTRYRSLERMIDRGTKQ